MAGVASIAWLCKGGIGAVNRIGSSFDLILGYIIYTALWRRRIRTIDGATQAGFELLSLIIDQYQQNELSEGFI